VHYRGFYRQSGELHVHFVTEACLEYLYVLQASEQLSEALRSMTSGRKTASPYPSVATLGLLDYAAYSGSDFLGEPFLRLTQRSADVFSQRPLKKVC